VRQNHAIEHGTVAVLLERGARTPLAGNATPGGFNIYGYVSTEDVDSAASEALHRLQNGNSELAVSPYCGTNLMVGALLAGLLLGVIMGRSRSRLRRLPVAAFAVVGSTLLGRPLGNMVQRRFTTLADVEGVEIAGIRCIKLGKFNVHRISTGLKAR
jgi:hypothetical protein